MGDRRNIIITESVGTPGVAIYTHWGGSEAPKDLAEALDTPEARNRMSDVGYLTRIIFDRLSAHCYMSETGMGIYPSVDGKSSPMEDFPGYDLIVETAYRQVLRLGHKSVSVEDFIANPNILD